MSALRTTECTAATRKCKIRSVIDLAHTVYVVPEVYQTTFDGLCGRCGRREWYALDLRLGRRLPQHLLNLKGTDDSSCRVLLGAQKNRSHLLKTMWWGSVPILDDIVFYGVGDSNQLRYTRRLLTLLKRKIPSVLIPATRTDNSFPRDDVRRSDAGDRSLWPFGI